MIKKFGLLTLVVSCIFAIGLTYFLRMAGAQNPPTPISGKFYKFDLVAQQGQNGINGLSGLVSINDSGTVAFAAHPTVNTNSVNQLFIRKVNGQVTAITTPTLPDGTDWRVFGSVQINNSEQVIAKHERRKPGGGFAQEVRLWDGNAVESGLLIAAGDTDINSGARFWRILDATSINNAGQAVIFGAEQNPSTNTVLAVGSSTTLANDFNSAAKPMIGGDTVGGNNVIVKGDATLRGSAMQPNDIVANRRIYNEVNCRSHFRYCNII